VTHYAADIRIPCADCGRLFGFIGLPGGLHPEQPTTSLAVEFGNVRHVFCSGKHRRLWLAEHFVIPTD
jgi:hypothetical protein